MKKTEEQNNREKVQELLEDFYGNFWSRREEDVCSMADEIEDRLEKLDMRDYLLLADSYPEYSLRNLYVRQEDVINHAFFTFVLYGESGDEESFLKVIQSIKEQSIIWLKIMVPKHMKENIEQAGLMQGNICFVDAASQEDLFCCALCEKTEYMVFGDKEITYGKYAFRDAFRHLKKSSADFVAELLYHRNYGTAQAVLLNQAAFDSQRGGYEYHPYLSFDFFLANKFFRTSFLQSSQEVLRSLPLLYRTGGYIFADDEAVFYEEEQDTFADFVGTKETMPFIQEFLRDKEADLNSPEILNNPVEISGKLLDFPEKTLMQKLFKKMVSYLRRKKVKEQVLFFTIRKNRDLEGNAKALYPYVKGKKVIQARLLPHGWIQQLKMYYAMITSKVIVTDDYNRYLRYFPLRKNQRVIQLWHACGAFKKFGRRGTNHKVLVDSATHAQYNIAAVSGKYIRPIYADAFHIDLNKVKALGCPRTDDFFNESLMEEKRKDIYRAYPEFRDRKVILYAPTFRDRNHNRQEFRPQLDFDRLSNELLPEQIFVICPHPVMQNAIVEKKYENIRVVRKFSTNDMMLVSELLVTDYSSVIFEYALLQKPIVFYCYDLPDYDRGFYLNYPDDLPGEVYETQDELTEYLTDTKRHVLTEKHKVFAGRYMSACDGHSCERIARLINDYMEENDAG